MPSFLMDATTAEDWRPNEGRAEKNPALLKTLDRLRYVAGIPPGQWKYSFDIALRPRQIIPAQIP
jgi:hypothetical protein